MSKNEFILENLVTSLNPQSFPETEAVCQLIITLAMWVPIKQLEHEELYYPSEEMDIGKHSVKRKNKKVRTS